MLMFCDFIPLQAGAENGFMAYLLTVVTALRSNGNKTTAPRKGKGPQGKGSLRVIVPARKGQRA
ncbi:hypothetical protein JR65_004278 [Salmonella enterica]|nr:hypothetical protein [Salmonella enterica subsp. enterica serovar Llandoff]EAY0929761.1 hypothetical protein [Salmonella enterica]EBU8677360.1 hypothetical protein [Salmonella enterica subsp. enterica serovar Parkroyal]EBZ7424036.1 hypothetical protein [Salmonella enterica subsp. enterica serovar Bonariensis]ECI4870396.1 hypothetical protein [Salmonella enterica subsp. enterica]EDS3307873.1 hypothetical protein [Salmonella enterica subsp. enterica serovar Umbadah]EDU6487273.1 hypothetical 